MKKELTREEVEKCLHKYTNYIVYNNILNDLFGKPFEVGDWVVVTKIPTKNHWIIESDKRTFKLLGLAPFYGTSNGGTGHGLDGCEFRHATPEEIAEDTWEEGKPYRLRVCDHEEWLVRISSKKRGFFYDNGYFSGKTFSWNQYEKL